MKILVISDTHGRLYNIQEAIEREKPDRIYHLGDGEGCEDFVRREYDIPYEGVRGNCDFMSSLPEELVMTVGKHVVMLCHGHRYNVRTGTSMLEARARELGADVALYGHTHIPDIEYRVNLTILNPGSLSEPRQPSRIPTYAVIEVDRDGDMKLSLKDIR